MVKDLPAMSGLNKSDPATHRIYNKEGVTHVNQVPAPRSGEERLGIANRNESGPGMVPSSLGGLAMI